MVRCKICDGIINWDGSREYCLKHFAEQKLEAITGLSIDNFPDSLPIEDYVDEDGNLDFDGISAW